MRRPFLYNVRNLIMTNNTWYWEAHNTASKTSQFIEIAVYLDYPSSFKYWSISLQPSGPGSYLTDLCNVEIWRADNFELSKIISRLFCKSVPFWTVLSVDEWGNSCLVAIMTQLERIHRCSISSSNVRRGTVRRRQFSSKMILNKTCL